MLRRGSLSSLCALALWLGGCPKRQGPARIVYVPAPAPQAAGTEPTPGPPVMVIEEPAPPEPEETPPAQTPEPAAHRGRRRPAREEAPAAPVDTTVPETPEPPPAPIPALEPRESTAREVSLRQQIQRLHADVRERAARLNQARLSANERKTLEDARTFFAQSERALASGDLERALNLARKASLLVTALE